MKALFSRFKASASSRETTKPPPLPSSPSPAVDRDYADEKSLRSLQNDLRSNAHPRPFSTASLAKPLPDRPFQPLPPLTTGHDNFLPSRPSLHTPPPTHTTDKQQLSSSTTSPTPPQHDSSGRSSRKTTASSNPPLQDVHKKVAFISPLQSSAAQKPPDALVTIPAPATPTDDSKRRVHASEALPSKSQVSKLIAIHDGRTSTQSTTSTVKLNATSAGTKSPSRPNLPSPTHASAQFNAVGIPIFRPDAASIRGPPSLRAGTPFSQMSQRSGMLATASWSEAAEEDLVSNIGQRERTRQEVLWEIVASEERYVLELIKMKETFIDPLLHPFAATPLTSMQEEETWRIGSPAESVDHLPIASRFLASSLRTETPNSSARAPLLAHNQATETPVIPTPDNDSTETDDDDGQYANDKSLTTNAAHPRSPYGTAVRGINLRTGRPILPYHSQSHHSLPPPPRLHTLGAVSASSLAKPLDRPGTVEPERKDGTRVLKKLKRNTVQEPVVKGVPPHLLPEDLRRCLEVIETGILVGHVRLSEALRKRYEEQYPLVRSLADVFVTNSIILNEYATYVLHLERALEQIDSALSAASIMQRPKKQDAGEWVLICRTLQKLEENAADKGETGLAISLSKPFQRLLKYPLLFQNLLFHTDPSTFEYESTLQMVAEVESIVRSIEDEKIHKEERDKTRDIFARIDGLEKDKILAVFKPSRMLIEERPLDATSYDPPTKGTPPFAIGGATFPSGNQVLIVSKKTSFRRISEVLQPSTEKGVGGKKDLWLVVFNDVVLRCQRTGVTSLPLATTTNSRASSAPEMQAKSKYGTTRRAPPVRTRNLYRFIKVESWTINQKPKPRDIVSKEDIERSRTHLVHAQGADDETEDGENDSDDSDRKSKMSFSYWGADKVTLTKVVPSRRGPANSRAPSRAKPQAPSSFAGRSSEKDAKFGTRMRSPEPSTVEGSVRPASRRTGITSPQPATRRNVASSEDSKIGDITPSRPAWGQNTRAAPVPVRLATTPYSRARNLSQTSVQPTSRVINGKMVGSPAPSEDSGVGMYKRIVAHDPTMN